MELIELIKSDLSRLDTVSIRIFLKYYFFPRGTCFRFQFWLRILSELKHRKFFLLIRMLVYLIFRHQEYKYGIHVNSNIKIGKGLLIVHGDGVFLNCRSIGDNFTCYQGGSVRG